MTNEEIQQMTISALVERVMALETWRIKIENDDNAGKERDGCGTTND
jgi:hypothetical protein